MNLVRRDGRGLDFHRTVVIIQFISRGTRVPTTAAPTIIGPTDGESVTLQTIGVRFMIPGADSDARFSLVEHPMPPSALAAPLHRHNREDEYSFILEGRMGALLGDDVVE